MKSDEFRKQIEDEKVEGWQVLEDGDERVVLVKRKYGSLIAHVLIAFLTGWWTLFMGNAAYAAYKYFFDADKKVIRDEAAAAPSNEGGE